MFVKLTKPGGLKMLRSLSQFVLVTIIIVPLLGSAANAAAEYIECPLTQARTEITSPLPSGWWQTPQQGSLEETKIQNIGGTPTLMCGYWAYGQTVYVMREAPAGATCTADGNGFTCTTPGVVAPSAPVTHKTGPLSWQQTWMVDFDNGTTGGRDGADIWFEAVTATERYLVPVNGAQMAFAGGTSINLAGCQALASYTTGRIAIEAFPVGMYVCVKTDEGRIAQFRVNAAPGASPGTMEIGYTTWAN